MKVSPLDRLLFLITALVASYQIAIGIEGLGSLPLFAYTVGFGVLLVSALLILILGFEVLQSPLVILLATLIPLSLACGLVWEYLPGWGEAFAIFALLGMLAIGWTRFTHTPRPLATLTLAVVHGVAGITIFGLPLGMVITQRAGQAFLLVSAGGGLIGVMGLLLSFLRMGVPLLDQEKLLRAFPPLFLVITIAYVLGFNGR
ncbi:MAG: hypothetical protein ANABAC_1401 [Anaerolineae bacterium]|jgi:hypothetical protein|nr:MAG: hypothetical protein ANABAC_1401 [Anaerolineae bacterium]